MTAAGSTSTGPVVTERVPSRWPIVIMLGIAVAWVGALATVVLVDANPVVLNRAQVYAADVVVTGRLERDGTSLKLQVMEILKGTFPDLAPTPTVSLDGPLPTMLPQGTVIAPLSRRGESGSPSYQITQGEFPNLGLPNANDQPRPIQPALLQPLLYPDTPDARAQLAAILAEFRPAE